MVLRVVLPCPWNSRYTWRKKQLWKARVIPRWDAGFSAVAVLEDMAGRSWRRQKGEGLWRQRRGVKCGTSAEKNPGQARILQAVPRPRS